jgi:hypothetical protein
LPAHIQRNSSLARGTVKQTIHRSKSSDYLAVAENFYSGADLAREFEYWNAAGVLIVHTAIALTDAITVRLGGVKSRGEDHHEAISILESLVASPDTSEASKTLRKIIDHTTLVSYSGEIYHKPDIEKLWRWLTKHRSWALTVLRK